MGRDCTDRAGRVVGDLRCHSEISAMELKIVLLTEARPIGIRRPAFEAIGSW